MNDGLAKAREVAAKIKEETTAQNEQHEVAKQEVKNQLVELSQNSELAKLYQDNAQVGAENLAGELPLLKVHATGRSTANEMADGTEPKDGAFFYKPTKEQFETITCHVLTISKGYRAEGLAQGDEKAKEIFNQILGGVIVDGTDYKPFIMYFTGLKLSYLWDFSKEAAKYTRAKPVSIPMFALTVQLSTTKVTNKFGKSWVVNLTIDKNEAGFPNLVMAAGEFQFLRDSVENIEDTIASLISARTAKGADLVNGEVVNEEPQLDSNGMPF